MNESGGILLLGASSYVGRFLLPRLTGESVTALSRVAQPPMPGVRWVEGDLADPKTLDGIGSVQRVFSVSSIWLLPAALPRLRALGMNRLVAVSSTSRFTKQQSTSDYERQVVEALAEGEAAVESFCCAYGIGFTILRPTLIYAEGQDANVSRIAGLIRRLGVFPLAGAGRGLRQPVHASDLAAVALAAMQRPATNRAYDVPGGETLTYRAMVERIFEGMGRAPRVLPLPLSLIRLGYALAKPLLPGSRAEMIGRMNDDLVFDPADARRDLDWSPRDFHPRFQPERSD